MTHPNDRTSTVDAEEVMRLRTVIAEQHDEIERLRAERDELAATLREIERFGHGDGHGRGYTCANVAQAALAKLEGRKHETPPPAAAEMGGRKPQEKDV